MVDEIIKKEYKRICDKLGCTPKDITFPDFETEDDNWINPFSVLTSEENEFLYKNGYLSMK